MINIKNKALGDYLKQFADFYFLEKDKGRMLSFFFAADKVYNFNQEVNINNFKNLESKGLKKSLLQEVEYYLNKLPSDRFKYLQDKWPANTYKQLLDLFNFDFEYTIHLWNTYKCDSLPKLQLINEPRVVNALNKNSTTSKEHQPIDSHKYYTLGDALILKSDDPKISLNEIIKLKTNTKDKYLFVVENIPSPNLLSFFDETKLDAWILDIKKFQIDSGIRIWKGCQVDVDLEGNPFLTKTNLALDFICIKTYTRPHTNKVQRLLNAANTLSKNYKVVIDAVDRFLSYQEFLEIVQSGYSIAINSNFIDYFFQYYRSLSQEPLTFYNNDILIVDNLDIENKVKEKLLSILDVLNIDQTKIINAQARPFLR